eukprot:COSAG06_NODE_16839_length_977_cov_2.300683_1_plen_72_part_01
MKNLVELRLQDPAVCAMLESFQLDALRVMFQTDAAAVISTDILTTLYVQISALLLSCCCRCLLLAACCCFQP